MSYVYRLWCVLLPVYLLAMGVLNREAILRPEPHDFAAAWEYGVAKNLHCAFPQVFVCKSDPAALFALQRNRLLEEDFNLIVTFAVLPMASLAALIIAEKAVTVALFIAACALAARFVLTSGA